jgi:hypothetical protein
VEKVWYIYGVEQECSKVARKALAIHSLPNEETPYLSRHLTFSTHTMI